MNLRVTIGAAVFAVIALMSILVVLAQKSLQEGHDLRSRQSRINSSLALLTIGLNELEASADAGTENLVAFSRSVARFRATTEQAGQIAGDYDVRAQVEAISKPLVAQLGAIGDPAELPTSGVARIRSARAEFGQFFNERLVIYGTGWPAGIEAAAGTVPGGAG